MGFDVFAGFQLLPNFVDFELPLPPLDFQPATTTKFNIFFYKFLTKIYFFRISHQIHIFSCSAEQDKEGTVFCFEIYEVKNCTRPFLQNSRCGKLESVIGLCLFLGVYVRLTKVKEEEVRG
mgnify:CR=1 FL=1